MARKDVEEDIKKLTKKKASLSRSLKDKALRT